MKINRLLKVLNIIGLLISICICVVSYLKKDTISIFIAYLIIGLLQITQYLLLNKEDKTE